jgi:ubiquinone/menaquinone biosynthesis C-methylase UbiE
LVLGGIPDEQIEQSIAEFERVLRPGGLFFYVENTANAASADYWFFRDEDTYARLAAFCKPQVLGRYEDMGQTITIFAGRKS